MKFKNKIAVFFVLVGIGVLVFSLAEKNKKNNRTAYLNTRNHPIKKKLISAYIDPDTTYDALALFVVADELCSSCINEIVEYTDAVSKYINSPLNRFKILRYGFVVGDDSADYKQITHLIQFPFSSSLLDKKSRLAKKLRQWKQDISGMNQIVLVDLRRDEVVGRIGIFTFSTTPVFKKNLVQQAFYELEKQDNAN